MVTQDLVEELRPRLLETRQRLEGEIANLTLDSRADTFQADEMTDVVDQHDADQASELYERENNMTLQAQLEATLQLVNTALQKMDDGTYGTCDRCGKQIDERRLRALPEAQYDIECQEIVDKERARAAL